MLLPSEQIRRCHTTVLKSLPISDLLEMEEDEWVLISMIL